MNKKFLSILTGVSALAVAGLLSIIPSSVSHAAPSQAPATVTTIHVEDHRSGYAYPDGSPAATDVNCEFEYSYSGRANICNVSFRYLQFTISQSGTAQQLNCDGRIDDTVSSFGPRITMRDSISGTFRFTYAGSNYAASIHTSVAPTDSGYSGAFSFYETDDYEIHPSNPSTPGTPAAPSENPGTPSDDPAAKAFNEAINNTVNEIELAILGLNADGTVNETRTVEYKSSGAISPKIIYALAHAENVTLIYTFEYEGIIFQSAITSEAAAAMYSPTIPWYGPCYIATFCPPIPIGFVQ